MGDMAHYLNARHAYREGRDGCDVRGTQRVVVDGAEATCPECLHYYWHVEGLALSPAASTYLAALEVCPFCEAQPCEHLPECESYAALCYRTGAAVSGESE